MNNLLEHEIEKVQAAIEKTFDQAKIRMSAVESFAQDKIELVKQEMRYCENKVSQMATVQMMDKLTEDNKGIKMKF